MARNVRNFWIELDVDGYKTKVKRGPRGRFGGFHMIISMRDNGEISNKQYHIRGGCCPDESLILTVDDCKYPYHFPNIVQETRR